MMTRESTPARSRTVIGVVLGVPNYVHSDSGWSRSLVTSEADISLLLMSLNVH